MSQMKQFITYSQLHYQTNLLDRTTNQRKFQGFKNCCVVNLVSESVLAVPLILQKTKCSQTRSLTIIIIQFNDWTEWNDLCQNLRLNQRARKPRYCRFPLKPRKPIPCWWAHTNTKSSITVLSLNIKFNTRFQIPWPLLRCPFKFLWTSCQNFSLFSKQVDIWILLLTILSSLLFSTTKFALAILQPLQ